MITLWLSLATDNSNIHKVSVLREVLINAFFSYFHTFVDWQMPLVKSRNRDYSKYWIISNPNNIITICIQFSAIFSFLFTAHIFFLQILLCVFGLIRNCKTFGNKRPQLLSYCKLACTINKIVQNQSVNGVIDTRYLQLLVTINVYQI